MISVREAKALPKTNSQQWKNKYICVEGIHFTAVVTSQMTHCCRKCITIPCVSEPFERNNVARAVHEKAKFDAIRAQFAEVRASADDCFSSHPLWVRYELFLIRLTSL